MFARFCTDVPGALGALQLLATVGLMNFTSIRRSLRLWVRFNRGAYRLAVKRFRYVYMDNSPLMFDPFW